jgi:hypothetical protein
MPRALSLDFTEAKKAIELKIIVRAKPVKRSDIPVASNEYIRIGIPAPIRNAVANDKLTPANSLSSILVLLIGCDSMSSINSYEL